MTIQLYACIFLTQFCHGCSYTFVVSAMDGAASSRARKRWHRSHVGIVPSLSSTLDVHLPKFNPQPSFHLNSVTIIIQLDTREAKVKHESFDIVHLSRGESSIVLFSLYLCRYPRIRCWTICSPMGHASKSLDHEQAEIWLIF